MSNETPDTTAHPDGTLTINRAGRYRIGGPAPRAILTYQAACDVFERNQVGKDTALVTLDDLRSLAINAQRIVVDDLTQQLAEPVPETVTQVRSWETVRHHQQATTCPRCGGSKVVPNFQDWDQALDEPRPKPCPKCAGGNE